MHITGQDQATSRVVYIRALRADELPQGAVDGTVYAIHDENGQRVGIAPERELAFTAARQHQLHPVSVH